MVRLVKSVLYLFEYLCHFEEQVFTIKQLKCMLMLITNIIYLRFTVVEFVYKSFKYWNMITKLLKGQDCNDTCNQTDDYIKNCINIF